MRNGFSLLELSISLLIISLIIGGIMAGQNIMHAAELRSVYTEASKYMESVGTFSDKYGALPSDFSRAASIWGAQDSGDGLGSDCTGAASTGKATCNGNGDGKLGNDSSSYYESFRAWQHLANAGIIEGKYNGISDGAVGTNNATPGKNVPKSALGGAVGYNMRFADLNSSLFSGVAYDVNIMDFGAKTGSSSTNGAILTAADAWSIDKKLDDGKPASGSVMSYNKTAQPSCVTTNVATTSLYAVDNSAERACSLFFLLGY